MVKSKFLSVLIGIVIIFQLAPTVNAQASESSEKKVYFEGSSDYINVRHSPKNFNPLTASDAELEYYLYPPRAKDSIELKEWKRIV